MQTPKGNYISSERKNYVIKRPFQNRSITSAQFQISNRLHASNNSISPGSVGSGSTNKINNKKYPVKKVSENYGPINSHTHIIQSVLSRPTLKKKNFSQIQNDYSPHYDQNLISF